MLSCYPYHYPATVTVCGENNSDIAFLLVTKADIQDPVLFLILNPHFRANMWGNEVTVNVQEIAMHYY